MARLLGTAHREAFDLLFYLDHLQRWVLVGRRTGLRICLSTSSITNLILQPALLDWYSVRFSLYWHLAVVAVILNSTAMVIKLLIRMGLAVDLVSAALR